MVARILHPFALFALSVKNCFSAIKDHILQEGFGLSSSPGLLGRRAGQDMTLPIV